MVNPSLLDPIEDLRQWYPDAGFAGNDTFSVGPRGLIIADPTYLADVFNRNDYADATYVRVNAVIASDFGGDASCPVWWHDPYLILPLSSSGSDDLAPPDGAVELASEIGCDAGAFSFLPLRSDLPESLAREIRQLLVDRNAAQLNPPSGNYRVFYEQHETPADSQPSFHRNIIARRKVAGT